MARVSSSPPQGDGVGAAVLHVMLPKRAGSYEDHDTVGQAVLLLSRAGAELGDSFTQGREILHRLSE